MLTRIPILNIKYCSLQISSTVTIFGIQGGVYGTWLQIQDSRDCSSGACFNKGKGSNASFSRSTIKTCKYQSEP